MTFEELEKMFRQQLIENLMMKHAEFLDIDDELSLDSLSQTEIRIFIADTFNTDVSLQSMPAETTNTLKSLINHTLFSIEQLDTKLSA